MDHCVTFWRALVLLIQILHVDYEVFGPDTVPHWLSSNFCRLCSSSLLTSNPFASPIELSSQHGNIPSLALAGPAPTLLTATASSFVSRLGLPSWLDTGSLQLLLHSAVNHCQIADFITEILSICSRLFTSRTRGSSCLGISKRISWPARAQTACFIAA